MPSCRRCGRQLSPGAITVANWNEVTNKDFYSCPSCGGDWLYSKSLNCPVLIDRKNLQSLSKSGGLRRQKAASSVREGKKARSR